MFKDEKRTSKPFNYLKIKKALVQTNQISGDSPSNDKSWKVEVKKKEAEDKLNSFIKGPEEVLKLKEGDYDYYSVKRRLGLK